MAGTIGRGIIAANAITDQVVFGALMGAISWNIITATLGIPSSSSHALIGGLVGAALVQSGSKGVQWNGLAHKVVLLWAFDGSRSNPHRLENHRPNQVVYTSTHDTETVAGWGRKEPWEMIELAYGSRARLAIVPAQDVLGLGNEARMNRPGESEGNWSWRLEPGQLTDAHAARLRDLVQKTQRTGK